MSTETREERRPKFTREAAKALREAAKTAEERIHQRFPEKRRVQ